MPERLASPTTKERLHSLADRLRNKRPPGVTLRVLFGEAIAEAEAQVGSLTRRSDYVEVYTPDPDRLPVQAHHERTPVRYGMAFHYRQGDKEPIGLSAFMTRVTFAADGHSVAAVLPYKRATIDLVSPENRKLMYVHYVGTETHTWRYPIGIMDQLKTVPIFGTVLQAFESSADHITLPASDSQNDGNG